jgi:APA family basic amino acid/polyamine antiporter
VAEWRPKGGGLERVLGTGALFSTAYGNVGSSIYYALGLVASFALGLTPVVFLISGLIFMATAATYAEATTMYPEAGGSASFARHAFNEFWSFFAGWGQMLNYIITVSISAFFVPHYLGVFWPALRHSPGDIVFGIAVVALLALLNIVGIREASGINIVLAVVDFFTQLVLVVLGCILVLSPDTLVNNIHLGTAPTWTNFLIAIPVGMVAYTGIETISNMAEEAKDFGKTIPRSIGAVVVAVMVIYALLPAVALSAMPVKNGTTLLGLSEEKGGYAGDPVLGVVRNIDLGTLQHGAEIYVGVLAATILILATNAGLIGVSRLTYSMGQYRQLPDRLRTLHPRFRTPYIAILLFGAIACVTMLPGKAAFLGQMYAFGAMLSFTIAHMAVIALRLKEPDKERPWKGPGAISIRGRPVPLFAVFGGLGTGLAWIVVTVLNLTTLIVGTVWLAIGITTYVLYRRHLGLSLTETRKAELIKSAVEHEVEYESVLVAFEDADYSPDAVATAVKLAARRRRGVHVVVMITVPNHLPIDASLPDQERAAEQTIEAARVVGGRRATGHWEKVRPGQGGRRIVEEARAIKARALIMALPRRPRATGSPFPRTIETVLADRPCRVIITAEPPVRAAEITQAAA